MLPEKSWRLTLGAIFFALHISLNMCRYGMCFQSPKFLQMQLQPTDCKGSPAGVMSAKPDVILKSVCKLFSSTLANIAMYAMSDQQAVLASFVSALIICVVFFALTSVNEANCTVAFLYSCCYLSLPNVIKVVFKATELNSTEIHFCH